MPSSSSKIPNLKRNHHFLVLPTMATQQQVFTGVLAGLAAVSLLGYAQVCIYYLFIYFNFFLPLKTERSCRKVH